MNWRDGPSMCALADEDGEIHAEIIRDANGTWALFQFNGAVWRVRGGFATAAAAKAYYAGLKR